MGCTAAEKHHRAGKHDHVPVHARSELVLLGARVHRASCLGHHWRECDHALSSVDKGGLRRYTSQIREIAILLKSFST
jgi:hypothetical protein